jgi:glucose/arabinose dehydrogenase
VFGLSQRGRHHRYIFIAAGILFGTLASQALAAQEDPAQCRPGAAVRVPELPEGSGLAVSRSTPGRLWAHNDSGQPVIYALDSAGKVTGRVQVTGATVGDWEAVAVGPCGKGSCLHIGDIGDNNANRKRVTVYRLPEPEGATGSAAVAEVFHATYPDGPHDAEALLIDGDGRLYIVTKGETGPVAVYRFPAALKPGMEHRLERVGGVGAARGGAATRITDGAVSPDGEWAVLRTTSALVFYRASDLLAGRWRESARVDLAAAREPQGEGVALGEGNTVFVGGEGGGKGRPGTFARFTCAPKS